MTRQRREHLDALRQATLAEIEESERPIREGTAWPLPPYRIVLVANEGATPQSGSAWSASTPAVPCEPFEAPTIEDAERIGREKTCSVLRRADWGFQLDVETYRMPRGEP